MLFHLITIQSTSLIPPKTVCLTANTNQAVQQLNQNVVSSNYNTNHISDTTQNCLSLTANTILVDQHPIQSNQNVVSFDDITGFVSV
jgi:hypothetical protein